MSQNLASLWNSIWGNAPASSTVNTTISANNATYTAPSGIAVQNIVESGSHDTVTSNATTLKVTDSGSYDTTNTSSVNVTFVVQGADDTLNLTSTGANVALDLSDAPGGAAAATQLFATQAMATLVDLNASCCGFNWGCGGLPQLDVTGDGNKIKLGSYSIVLDISGHLNLVVGGSAASTVNLAGDGAAATVVVGGSGTMTVASTAAATDVIAGSGALCLKIDGAAANVVGGAGAMNATIHSDGGVVQTGSGYANVTFSGFGGLIATGTGTSVINYVTGPQGSGGGILYESAASGYTTFNVSADGCTTYGGDVVNMKGTGLAVESREAVRTDAGGSILAQFQGLGNGVYASMIGDANVKAALLADNPYSLPPGLTPASAAQVQACASSCNPCGSSYRIVNFTVESGSVQSDSRQMFVTVNGSNNSLYGGTVGHVYWIQSGEFNSYFAGAGNNTIVGDGGRNVLEYYKAPGQVTVNLQQGWAQNGYGGTDAICNINWAEAGSNATLIGGCANATLTVYGNNSTLQGGYGNDALTAKGDANRLIAGAGSDMMHTTGVDNSYVVGQFAAVPASTLITQDYVGVTGTLAFASAACSSPTLASQLWLQSDAAGDLVIDILGTAKSVTIANWFSGGTQLASITAGGLTLSNAAINTLEGAMATYQAGAGSFDPTKVLALPSDAGIGAAFKGWV